MAHKTLIGGTAYEISGGKTLIGGTAYSLAKGRTLVGGTGYDISFGLQPGPVNYVQTTGANYFDTTMYPVSYVYYRVVMDCEFVGTQPTDYPMAFGAWASASSGKLAWSSTKDLSGWYMYNGTTNAGSIIHTTGRVMLDADNMSGNWTVNGETAKNFGSTLTSPGRPIYLGAVNAAGTASFFANLRIYSCQHYYSSSASGTQELIRNYTPYMDANGKGYLYDSVYGTALYPSGSGDALVG